MARMNLRLVSVGILLLCVAVVPSNGIIFRFFRSRGGESCTAMARRMNTGCGEQYRWLLATFGRLWYPNLTPEKQTPEILARMPRPGFRCCSAAYDFQSALCACKPEVIQFMRETGTFDPEMTVPSARHIYGTLCGGPVTVGDDCPNGNPFDILRARG